MISESWSPIDSDTKKVCNCNARPFLDGLNGFAEGGYVAPSGMIPVNMDVPMPPMSDSSTNVGPTSITHNPTYNIMPAEGVTRAELVSTLQEHSKSIVGHISKNVNYMARGAHQRGYK